MAEKKVSYVDRALEFLKGGEKANIANIRKFSLKKWNKQITKNKM